jgi:hypothetical protein
MEEKLKQQPATSEGRVLFLIFVLSLGFHFWGITVGWQSRNLPGNEFRQTQTAISSHWINADNDFSLAYPTPILGKPWSIPMEFPLYQWTTVVVHRVTNWSLTKSGRAVSITCFYLALPAIFLLLGRWQVAVRHRWLVLAVILTCPFYVYFTRGVLIETMALMCSLWFWVAFERTVQERSKVWLLVAMLAGTGAGLVKVTTYLLYLLPAAWWACGRLWRNRRTEWLIDAGWMTAAVAVPFAATLGWLHFADATKAQNPLATFIVSSNLTEFNLGTNATRFSAEMWQEKLRLVGEKLTALPVMLFCAVLVLGPARRRWREVLGCVVCFASVLLLFPVLYTLHDYYYAANTILLITAMGLVLVALAEAVIARWIVYLALGLVLLGQVQRYVGYYYPSQRSISWGGDGLTRSLRNLTQPRDVIVVLGQDWNSMTPYYAQRRALMLRDDIASDPERVAEALAGLKGESIGALVIAGHPHGEDKVIESLAMHGLGRQPLYLWGDARVFLPREHERDAVKVLLEQSYPGVSIAPGVEIPQRNLANQWIKYDDLWPWERRPFEAMRPKPVRFFSQFGPNADGSSGVMMFGGHPVTRLVFSLPAGEHVLRSSLQMSLDAYRLDLPDSDATDGVVVTLSMIDRDGASRTLARRYFDPRHNRADRGERRPLEFAFNLMEAGEVELAFTPGPAGNLTRDWIELGPLKIH